MRTLIVQNCQSPIFLSKNIRNTRKIKIPTLEDAREVLYVTRNMKRTKDRIDYSESVGLDYHSIEEYYDTVFLCNKLFNDTKSEGPLYALVNKYLDWFRDP